MLCRCKYLIENLDRKNELVKPYIKISCFPEPNNLYTNKNKIEVELNLFNYATKIWLKNAIGANTSQFDKKDDLANLKSENNKLDVNNLEKVPNGLNSLKNKVDKLDVDRLKPVPIDLKELIDVVDNDCC